MQRRAVLDAARPVFANQGYHGATIEAIARGCGIPRPTVYEIFGGKDALFAAVLDDAAERVYGRLSASFAESGDMPLREFLRHSFTAVFDLFEQDRDAVMLLLNAEHSEDPPHPAPSEVRRRLLHDVAALTRSRWEALGVEVGDARSSLPGLPHGRGPGAPAARPDLGLRGADRPAHRVHWRHRPVGRSLTCWSPPAAATALGGA